MNVIEIKSKKEFEEEVLNSGEPVLVDFNANWCGPCQMLKPILEDLATDYKIVSVNTDDLNELASSYNVMSIPCMVLINGGKEEKRMIGLHAKEEIEEFLR